MDVVPAAGRRDQRRRVCCSATERVKPVRVGAKNCGVLVPANFHAPFEIVRTPGIDHVLFELVHVAIGSEDRAIGGIKTLEKAVSVSNRNLTVIVGREKRGAAYISESGRES